MTTPIKLPECVKMKHEIQARLMEKYKGLSDDERHERELAAINADPILGPHYRALIERGQVIKPQSISAAEDSAEYGPGGGAV